MPPAGPSLGKLDRGAELGCGATARRQYNESTACKGALTEFAITQPDRIAGYFCWRCVKAWCGTAVQRHTLRTLVQAEMLLSWAVSWGSDAAHFMQACSRRGCCCTRQHAAEACLRVPSLSVPSLCWTHSCWTVRHSPNRELLLATAQVTGAAQATKLGANACGPGLKSAVLSISAEAA